MISTSSSILDMHMTGNKKHDDLDERRVAMEGEGQDETIREWIRTQQILQNRIIPMDTAPWTKDLDTLDLVGGLDISYSKQDDSQAFACLVVFSLKTKGLFIQSASGRGWRARYQPGFLAFKEITPMLRLHEPQKESPQLMPSVWIVDGNGIMHERGIGLASHFGVLIDEPTIGAAKTPPGSIFSFVKGKNDMLSSDKEDLCIRMPALWVHQS